MAEQSTAVRTLMVHEPMLVIRPNSATLKYQTDNAAFSQPEGVIVSSPVDRTGVIVREEFESTAVPESFIL
jgi:hypothetical protein